MTTPATDPLAGLIADAREIPAVFQPRARPVKAPDAGSPPQARRESDRSDPERVPQHA